MCMYFLLYNDMSILQIILCPIFSAKAVAWKISHALKTFLENVPLSVCMMLHPVDILWFVQPSLLLDVLIVPELCFINRAAGTLRQPIFVLIWQLPQDWILEVECLGHQRTCPSQHSGNRLPMRPPHRSSHWRSPLPERHSHSCLWRCCFSEDWQHRRPWDAC